MNTQTTQIILKVTAVPLLALLLAAVVSTQTAHAQPVDCGEIIGQMSNAIQPRYCGVVASGDACYAHANITASPTSSTADTDFRFTVKGDQEPIGKFSDLHTYAPSGSAIMVADTDRGPVKIMVMGGTRIEPSSTQPQVFTMRRTNEGLVCEKTSSGLLLQTESGRRGRITVNGVTVEIGSTALLSVEGEVLFDQDPRRDRREGRRNPDAPLCSGFDSQCDFGDSSCPINERLVWGPYCREDSYANIRSGLYRMSLFGRGSVRAGATDYNVAREPFSFGSSDFTLPGSFTFCWPGLEPGGTGFETIVHSRSQNARVDHITLEYLGADCNANVNSSRPNMMTVTNVEGDVTVRAAGAVRSPAPGQAVRVHYQGTTPVVVDRPHPADVVVDSDLTEWLTFDEDGMPEVNSGVKSTPTPTGRVTDTPPDPIASFEQVGISRVQSGGEAVGLVLEVSARDPSAGRLNGAGIDSVRFRIFDPDGALVLDNTERTPAYCAFGGNDPCAEFVFQENGNEWPSGASITRGIHIIRARVTTDRGAKINTSTRIDIQPEFESSRPSDQSGPDIGEIEFDPVWTNGALCAFEPISGLIEIYDDSDVESALFFYRHFPLVGTATLWASASMERVDDSTFAIEMGEFDPGGMEYLIRAADGAGNESQTPVRGLDVGVCATID